MKIMLYKAGLAPEFTEIENTLKSMQAVVGGYIQVVNLTPHLALICDEEGKLKGKPASYVLCENGRHPSDVLVGDFFICRVSGEDFTDIAPGDEDISAYFVRPVGAQP